MARFHESGENLLFTEAFSLIKLYILLISRDNAFENRFNSNAVNKKHETR